MNLPETKTLILRQDGGVLHVTLNRPETRNAMSPEMVAELEAVLAAVRPGEVRALVLRGAGGHFCAGGDLKSMMGGLKAPAPGEPDGIAVFNRAFGQMLRNASRVPCVLIAVCEGAVMGGGFGLACVSDIALSHVDAKFGLPETTRGLPPAQIAPFVVERVGLTQARRLALTGASFKGSEAHRLGLVHELFASDEELQAKLTETLKQVLNCAPQANAITKQIVLDTARGDLDTVLDEAALKFAACVRGPEAPEGIAAFMQKRMPKWAQ